MKATYFTKTDAERNSGDLIYVDRIAQMKLLACELKNTHCIAGLKNVVLIRINMVMQFSIFEVARFSVIS